MSSLKNLFVPSEENNYKARLLHPSFLVLQLFAFLAFQLFLNFFLLVKPSVLGFASSITPEKIVELTNQKRAERSLPALRFSSTLSEAAGRKAGDMFAFNYWAHTSPSGRDPWSFFREAGYSYLYAGENLARDFADSSGVIEAWLNSPSHRDNLLGGRYQEIGVAVVNGTLLGTETTLVVQLFGTPKAVVAKKPTKPVVEAKEVAVAPAEKPQLAPQPETEVKAQPQPQVQAQSETKAETPLVAEVPSSSLVEGSRRVPVFSPLDVTKVVGLLSLGFLSGLFAFELAHIKRRGVARLSGRNLAHASFLGIIILIIVLSSQGAIL
ncbi:CAP domain-containing protein [Candidatus Shapirobacteria bacterium]|nr:CAP domain-containing protein [Candidatus Shapirobacteria bacterium]